MYRYVFKTNMTCLFLFLMGIQGLIVTAALGQAASQTGVEVETRGPVHEGYAEPVTSNPQPGIVISQAPPAAIEEMPPDQQPGDETAIWIPGYWGWDDDRNDFIWISGIWRIPPPGNTWVPGYWTKVQDGAQWISGFWQPADTQDISYLPPPPQSLDEGPAGPPRTPDDIWCPGYWNWQETRYVWRPGFWMPGRQNWVWNPSHYVWTPRGMIFVAGYWDYPIENRGILFAPVYLERKVYFRRPFVYTPAVVINTGALTAHFFSRPRYDHYYFGDYYGKEYSQRGIRPWFEVSKGHRVSDPIFVYQKWQNRHTNPTWSDKIRRDFELRKERVELRPARTYAQQQAVTHRLPDRDRTTVIIGQPLNDFRSNKNAPIRIDRTKPEYRDLINRQGTAYRKFTDQRAQWEAHSIQGKPDKDVKVNVFRQQNVRVPRLVLPVTPNAQRRTLVVPPRPEPQNPVIINTPPRPGVKINTPARVPAQTIRPIQPESRRDVGPPIKSQGIRTQGGNKTKDQNATSEPSKSRR
jgi:hypothetical protein